MCVGGLGTGYMRGLFGILAKDKRENNNVRKDLGAVRKFVIARTEPCSADMALTSLLWLSHIPLPFACDAIFALLAE